MPWALEEDPFTPIRLVVLTSSLRETVWGRGLQRGLQEVKSVALESC